MDRHRRARRGRRAGTRRDRHRPRLAAAPDRPGLRPADAARTDDAPRRRPSPPCSVACGSERGVVALVFVGRRDHELRVSPPGRASSTGWRTTPCATRLRARDRRPAQHPVHERRPAARRHDRPVRSRRGPRRWAPGAPAAIRPASRRRHPVHGRHDPVPASPSRRSCRRSSPSGSRTGSRTWSSSSTDDGRLRSSRPRMPTRPIRRSSRSPCPMPARRRSESAVGDTLAANVDGTRPAAAEHLPQARGADPDRDRRDVLGPGLRGARLVRRHEPRTRSRSAGPMDTRSHTRPPCSRPRPMPTCSASSCRAATAGRCSSTSRSSTRPPLDVLDGDLRRLGSTFATTGSVRPGTPLLRTGLLGIVERYLDAARHDGGGPRGGGPRPDGRRGRRGRPRSASSSSGVAGRRSHWHAVAVRRAASCWRRSSWRGCWSRSRPRWSGSSRRSGRDRPGQRRLVDRRPPRRVVATALLVARDLATRPARPRDLERDDPPVFRSRHAASSSRRS